MNSAKSLCPTCHRPLLDNRYRPFCSERCKLIDLGSWASEEYKVATSEPPPSENEADEQ